MVGRGILQILSIWVCLFNRWVLPGEVKQKQVPTCGKREMVGEARNHAEPAQDELRQAEPGEARLGQAEPRRSNLS